MQRGSRKRVIVDTNLWISFLIGKKLSRLEDLLINNAIQLVISDQLIEEMRLVTSRPKFIKYFPVNKVSDLIKLLKIIGLKFEPKDNVTICRDPKDNFLLSLAKSSHAHFLVTSDKDLLVLKRFMKTRIIAIKEFERLTKEMIKI